MIIPKDLEEKLKEYDEVEDYNSREGELEDGFYCDKCKNRGKFLHYYEGSKDTYTLFCECWNRRKFLHYVKKNNLQHLLEYKLNNFDTTKPFQKEMYNLAINYSKSRTSEWFVLLGQSGTGKTHVTSSILTAFARKNINVEYMMYTTYIEFVKRNAYNDDKQDQVDKLIKQYKDADVLYIDDLFKGVNLEKGLSSFELTNVFDLINDRYVNFKTTLITSEIMMDQLFTIDEALAGRIVERCKEYLLEIGKGSNKNYRIEGETYDL